MKKASIIGLLIVGLIFQNCKNDKTQPAVLSNDDTETVVEQEDAIKVNETSEVEKEISSLSFALPTSKLLVGDIDSTVT